MREAPSDAAQPAFVEVQRFRQPWLLALLAIPLVLLLVAAYVQLVGRAPFGDDPMSDEGLLIVAGVFLAFIGWFLSLRLTTEVCEDALHVQLSPLWRRKRIPYQSIRKCEARTYQPIREYGGWGIRCGYGRGWAYNVSGNCGVQLELDDGKRLLIGSQRADELARAMEERRTR